MYVRMYTLLTKVMVGEIIQLIIYAHLDLSTHIAASLTI